MTSLNIVVFEKKTKKRKIINDKVLFDGFYRFVESIDFDNKQMSL